jgi:hypothetical protein
METNTKTSETSADRMRIEVPEGLTAGERRRYLEIAHVYWAGAGYWFSRHAKARYVQRAQLCGVTLDDIWFICFFGSRTATDDRHKRVVGRPSRPMECRSVGCKIEPEDRTRAHRLRHLVVIVDEFNHEIVTMYWRKPDDLPKNTNRRPWYLSNNPPS